MSIPRPHYPTYPGGKRMPSHSQTPRQSTTPPMPQQTPPPPPVTSVSSHHEEIVRFVYDAWTRATNESNSDPSYPVSYYQEKEQHPLLKDFKPFDLEAWNERRKAEQGTTRPSS